MAVKIDCTVIGGGIVGLSAALALGRKQPGARITVLEKEVKLAQHQTGRNSGVIHSGIYYKPGSLKARFAREGNRSMIAFCREHGIAHEICGKIIVAVNEKEIGQLDVLYRRGCENGLEVSKLSSDAVREIEPHVRCLSGIRVTTTGIVSYREVAIKYRHLIEQQGGVISTGAKALSIQQKNGAYLIETNKGAIESRFLINCGGLYSDRLARLSGLDPEARIVPFRGEYYELRPEKRYLINTLVYPTPNPEFPFLGVHFTKMIDGSVHAGPNAVLAFGREGYKKTDWNVADLFETLAFPGFWKLARRHYRDGLVEMYRSANKAAFVRSVQRIVPEVRAEDLIPSQAGVRAQALTPDGKLCDDFLFVKGPNSIHVCNAPSPGATASLPIGEEIAGMVPELR